MKIALVLSNDWELYGDGSGDYFDLQHKPLAKLMDAVSDYGAKITVMAEVGQQKAHMAMAHRHSWAKDIAQAWESILVEVINRKSDVQLHLHPQWITSTFQEGRWQLNYKNWSISSLSSDEIEQQLKHGKQYLEQLLRPFNPDYECIAFRAGGHCIQPSEVVVEKLTESGFLCDSSVVKGRAKEGFYDYTGAYSHFVPWLIADGDVLRRTEAKSLLELPVCTKSVFFSPLLKKLFPKSYEPLFHGFRIAAKNRDWIKENLKEHSKVYPASNRPVYTNHKSGDALKYLQKSVIRKKHYALNYDHLSPEEFCYVLQQIKHEGLKGLDDDDEVILPLVAIGHVKEMKDTRNVSRILDEVTKKFGSSCVFWSMTDAIRYCLSNKKVLEL